MKPLVEINNFSKDELKCKCGCNQFNYDDNFLVRLQAFRLALGRPLTVTSGDRCINHNKSPQVGGVETSLHQGTTKKVTACDVTNKDVKEIYELACKSGLFNEVIFYTKQNFCHLGWDKNQSGNYFKIK